MIRTRFLLAATASAAVAAVATSGTGFTITPLILQNDEIEPGVLVTLIESLDVNDSGDWILELGTNQPTAFNRVVMVNGEIRYRKGFGFDAPEGGLVSSFDSVRINANADTGWNLNFSGSLPSNLDSGVFFNDILLIQESDETTDTDALTPGTPYIGFFETRMNDHDQLFVVASVNDKNLPTTVDRVLVWLDYDADRGTFVERVLWKERDILPGQTEEALDFGTGTEAQAINNAGQAFFSVSLSGPSETNAALYIDDALVRQKGDESPIRGRTFTNIGTSTRLDMNAGADWVFVGSISGDAATNQVIVSNDRIVAQRGTPAPGTGVDVNTFGSAPVRIDDSGTVWWFANLTGDTATNAAIFRGDEPIVRKGLEYDGLVFTTIAGSAAGFSGITKGFAVSPNGRHLLFRAILDDGRRGAFLVSFPDDGCPNVPDLDGDGIVDGADLGILLNAWGTDGSADLNCDGVVDGADLGILLNAWTR